MAMAITCIVNSLSCYVVDGCPNRKASLIPGGAITYSWVESEIGTTVSQPCPCQDLVDLSGEAGMVVRHCGGTYSHGAQWREVDFSRCGLSVIAIQLCEVTLVCNLLLHSHYLNDYIKRALDCMDKILGL